MARWLFTASATLHSSKFFSATMALPLSSRPPHARNSHARVAFNESLARRCADHRAKKAEDHGYLFYSAHSGWGNQQVADSLELGLRLGGDPRCDTVSHCRAAAKDVGRTMMQRRVESGEAAADDRQFKCVALGLGG